jgi:hypothetical protein
MKYIVVYNPVDKIKVITPKIEKIVKNTNGNPLTIN